ncbi:MAG: enoyl-CoA hydratase/isomerase family protein [Pseudomonadota bacterium]|nr:enoyl-CoA hydratase/isomerase family protein [Pseudomonadota bacterium]
MAGSVQIERFGATLCWTLDNPRKNNALDGAMLEALANASEGVENDRGVRAVVLAGAGERAFCAGADIAEWGSLDSVDFMRRWIGGGHHLFDRLARLPVPVIAALEGWVFGGGLELAAICDLRIASPNASFALPEASIGVTPGWSGAQRLGRLLPQALVREMALTGARLDAQRMWSVGFVNEIVDKPLVRAMEIGERIALLAPRAVEATKLVIAAASGEGGEQAIDRLAAGLVAGTRDLREGVDSFRAKRKPDFNGD